MAHQNHEAHKAKISPEFSACLARLKPQQKIRALVMLRVDVPGETPTRRQSRAERQAIIERLRQASAPTLTEIDDILAHYSGKRLAANVNALGAVPVETTAAGIHALAASDQVKAILEDQAVSLSLPHATHRDCQQGRPNKQQCDGTSLLAPKVIICSACHFLCLCLVPALRRRRGWAVG